MSALLLQVAVKASVVFLATWIVTMTMRRQSAAARHLVWTLGISAALLLPVLGAATPAWDVSMPTAPPIVAVQTPADAPSTAAVDAPASDAASVALQPATPAPRAGNGGMTTPTILISLWLCGVLVSLLKLAGGVWRLRSIASSASVVDSDEWVSEAVHAASALRLRTAVSLRTTARTVVPVVCGIWRPTILLPLTAAGWSLERRRVVLLHESAHVKRHDCATLTLARVAAALHWFNPLAYVALKQLRAEQERAADDLVLMAGTEASAYADHLLEIARAFRASAPIGATALAMARPSEIEGRLLAILEPSRSRRPLSRAVR